MLSALTTGWHSVEPANCLVCLVALLCVTCHQRTDPPDGTFPGNTEVLRDVGSCGLDGTEFDNFERDVFIFGLGTKTSPTQDENSRVDGNSGGKLRMSLVGKPEMLLLQKHLEPL